MFLLLLQITCKFKVEWLLIYTKKTWENYSKKSQVVVCIRAVPTIVVLFTLTYSAASQFFPILQ